MFRFESSANVTAMISSLSCGNHEVASWSGSLLHWVELIGADLIILSTQRKDRHLDLIKSVGPGCLPVVVLRVFEAKHGTIYFSINNLKASFVVFEN